jgi:hypothetical protein
VDACDKREHDRRAAFQFHQLGRKLEMIVADEGEAARYLPRLSRDVGADGPLPKPARNEIIAPGGDPCSAGRRAAGRRHNRRV